MLRNIIIEGVDRLGKSTLIEGLQQELGFFQVIHYEKPKKLKAYGENSALALKVYQEKSFFQMLMMLSTYGTRYIMDRAHLGEYVYSPLYRHYPGDYVFSLEELMIESGHDFAESTLLVLLHTSDFSFIADDGLSFDFTKKDEEQDLFKEAFKLSKIKSKLMVDVNDGGKFKQPEAILKEVISKFYPEHPPLAPPH
jgi:hypothetical protein